MSSNSGKDAKKRAAPTKQSTLTGFFSASSSKKAKASPKTTPPKATPSKANGGEGATSSAKSPPAAVTAKSARPTTKVDQTGKPLVPVKVNTPPGVSWLSFHDNFCLVRKVANDPPRNKVAALDMDGTLVTWTSSSPRFYPSQLVHYNLWSSRVIDKLRSLYDDEGYKLVIVSNQGGVQKAHTGKKATLVKTVIDWIASIVDRPIYAVMSTKSLKKEPEKSFHKPTARLWAVAVEKLNKGHEFDVAKSFFVGDSADPDDPQGGVDLRFAQNVGKERGANLTFHTPDNFFGPGDADKKQMTAQSSAPPAPARALRACAALHGGYLKGPILLLLCGVQGSGKTTFCQNVVSGKAGGNGSGQWVALSQDTINNGKPGKREKVEAQANLELGRGNSVIIDRMGITPEQRAHFVAIAKSQGVPAHVVLLCPPKEVIARRVRNRKNHPGKVEGPEGAKRAVASIADTVPPAYNEGVDLISCTATASGAARLADMYRRVSRVINVDAKQRLPSGIDISGNAEESPSVPGLSLPVISLGTMGIGKRLTSDDVSTALSAGFRSIDTAPTYNNEDRVGDALERTKGAAAFVIVKIPKRATQADEVRKEIVASLTKLKIVSADLLLLHWPCDVISAGTLGSVWQEMERCLSDGLCRALGVCNFNAAALAQLLPLCTARPVVNQVERHPLLPCWDLVGFCNRNDIVLQAHTPLGQGGTELLGHTVVRRIANESGLTPAQAVLSWNMGHGVAVVPRSTSKDHMEEIVALKHKLTPKQMESLDAITTKNRFVSPPFMFGDKSFCW